MAANEQVLNDCNALSISNKWKLCAPKPARTQSPETSAANKKRKNGRRLLQTAKKEFQTPWQIDNRPYKKKSAANKAYNSCGSYAPLRRVCRPLVATLTNHTKRQKNRNG